MTMSRDQALALDAKDPLAPLRAAFSLPPGRIYLDGNSLGVLPAATSQRLREVVEHEWGTELIESWNSAGWIEQPGRIGDKIARLVGVGPGELVAADSTSVNLYKVLHAACAMQRADRPGRRLIVSERSNFPTDLYIAQSVAREFGLELKLVDAPEALPAALGGESGAEVAVLMLTQVNYRTGVLLDMAALTAAAHGVGALTVWDLAHSAGALPVALKDCDADFAIGCGYKYLNGGPGAPAFVWAHPRHADRFWQPLSGWMGHAAPFEFTSDYRPAPGIGRYLCGTPAILGMAALECGVDTVLAAEPLGGLAALRAKSLALTDLFANLVEERCTGHGLTLVSPREPARRGSQVCLARDEGAYAIVQALIARGVVGDFRAGDAQVPDILRFGFTPLYTRFVEAWDAVEHLRAVLESGEWKRAEFNRRNAVT
ncbi:kynureninase [Rivibacter subsaxonicus]|uniref:Kynureninase n=1 Tax=Rivibacter subsaxonicus TaxID=457575 RepID=A0A4Q7W0Y5_9BURK|nr:kynureninase [Rivibacter subsaxonicus]